MTVGRVVVVREIGNLVAEQGQWLAGWIAVPLDGVHLVLVAGGGRTPSALDKAAKAHAESWSRLPRRPSDVLKHELGDAHLKLAPRRPQRVAAHLGDDAGRVPELVELWHSTYGDDAVLDRRRRRAVPRRARHRGRFELTNAIDRGDVAWALEDAAPHAVRDRAPRQPKPLHPMQVMASLVRLLPAAAAARRSVDRDQGTGGARRSA